MEMTVCTLESKEWSLADSMNGRDKNITLALAGVSK
jgi:hypothetical protein